LGRIDWIENMRGGFSTSIGNSTTYNVQTTDLASDLDASLNYNATLEGKLGLNLKAAGFYSLTQTAREELGSSMRGIKNARLQFSSGFCKPGDARKTFRFSHPYLYQDKLV
jgi:hypothetical protein